VACGTGEFLLAIEFMVTVCLVVLFLHHTRFGRSDTPSYTLTFCVAAPEAVTTFRRMSPAWFSQVVLRSTEQVGADNFEYVFLVFPKRRSVEDTVSALKAEVQGISRISLIRPETLVEV
jgi:hypothetical protein